MTDQTNSDQQPTDQFPDWLDRARTASVTLLTLVDRNPHGAFPTGLPVEPWRVQAHLLQPTTEG